MGCEKFSSKPSFDNLPSTVLCHFREFQHDEAAVTVRVTGFPKGLLLQGRNPGSHRRANNEVLKPNFGLTRRPTISRGLIQPLEIVGGHISMAASP